MKTKKAQSELITTVLIILLVLAAVVIVWQVVQGTVKKGGEQVTTQGSCIGISVDITDVSPVAAPKTQFSVTRKGGGTIADISTTKIPTIKVVTGDGVQTSCFPTGTKWNDELSSAKCTITTANTYIEAAFVMPDGTMCPITGKITF